MLISKKHRFIFVHLYKNAGTSIMNALMPFCIPRWQLIGNLQWRERRQEGINRFLGRFIPSLNPQPYPKHSTAGEIIERMGEPAYRNYFSFAIIRNPWDWQYSIYSYVVKTPGNPYHALYTGFGCFENYIRWRCDEDNMPRQRDFVYSIEGRLLVSQLGRYECLEEDFRHICSRIGVNADLPKLNVSNTISYRKFYTNETRELVRKHSQPDIELFGYDF